MIRKCKYCGIETEKTQCDSCGSREAKKTSYIYLTKYKVNIGVLFGCIGLSFGLLGFVLGWKENNIFAVSLGLFAILANGYVFIMRGNLKTKETKKVELK